MSDVLSQTEVESLLAALDPAASDKPVAAAPTPASRPVDPLNGQISVYDFKRPERVSKEQMRAFQALHEGFSREFGAALSGMLRSIVEVKLISVDQLTYSEFVFSLENPTCFNLLESKGLNGNIILDLNPSIIFPIVDRLLGGGREVRSSFPNRALTEIELRLVSRITDLTMRGLEKAWANLCELDLRVSQVESNPQLVQIVPPNEVIVLISFEITMGDLRGIMNLCIPFNTIEPLAGKLSSDTWSAYTQRTADPRQKLSLETGVGRAKVHMNVQLAETTVTAQEMAELSVGDIVLTEKDSHQGLEVFVEGRPMFLAHAGVLKGHKAIQILGRIKLPRDVVDEQLSELKAEESPESVAN
ncbi:flagellar motor switch protein FliM [Calycomorphotria hydatis]|uniref:Flagellar motor switch protein FliM n=1 Tax=Calycomorphotria hydatis TaxID=2528027 RepID=A0A517TD09_9PLAN|nr:flagellar motor switch protein FliM [Calycomorphotria hydatis]QDT66259.1 Flagellar motor switch protein FliM [Calycomorphotria hydatis]